MNDFEWMSPTKFIFGHNAEKKVGGWADGEGYKKALVLYGKGHVVRSGLLDTVITSLDEAGVAHVELGGVRPNPEVNLVRQAVELARNEQVDFILGVGGGSVIDTAKACAITVPNDWDVWEFFAHGNPLPKVKALAVASVLTIPAAGSEASNSCVISNDELGLKKGINGDNIRCKAAFMNPDLTLSLPAYQTFAGVTDMMIHIIERAFSASGDVPVTDGIAFSLLRTIRSAALVVLRDPNNYDARASLMWASTLAHNGLCGNGRVGDWSSHGLEHVLSALKTEVTHGAGLAVIVPAWLRHCYRQNPARVARLGAEVFGVAQTGSLQTDALAAIDALQDFFCTIGMPRYLDEFGFVPADVDQLVEGLRTHKGDHVGSFKRMNMDDVRAIYSSAFATQD